MVKVLRVITRLNIGGPAQHAILLTKHLNGQQWASTLVTGQIDRQEGDMIDLAYAKGLEPLVITTLRNGAGPAADLISLVRLYRLFRRERPAIVHLHLFKARLLGGIAARLAGVPLVAETFHGTLFSGYYRPIVSRLLVAVERLLARLMNAVIAVSDEVASEIHGLNVADPEKVHVIPLGLDLDRFAQAAETSRILHEELGVSHRTLLVGTVGRLVPIKGLRYFIAAAAQVSRLVPEVRFVIIGDGPERAALERQVSQEGLDDRVFFLGWRRDVQRLYPDLDVVVLASLHEGTPVAIIEAMAAGRSVVATRVGGVPDVVQDGVTGLLVPPEDPGAIGDAVVRLLRSPDERRRLGLEARRHVHPRFTATRLAADMDALYNRMLGRTDLAKSP